MICSVIMTCHLGGLPTVATFCSLFLTCSFCKAMACRQGRPQQNNYDDCGIFAVMFASQMAMTDAAALHLIKAEHTMQYRFYLALCIIEGTMPGVLQVPVRNDGMSSAHVPSTTSHLQITSWLNTLTVQPHCHSCELCL